MKMTLFLILLMSLIPPIINASALPFKIKTYNTVSKKRLNLTIEYAKRHYNMNTYLLRSPKIIVIHYTALPTLKMSLGAFKKDTLPSYRAKLTPYGQLNVGTHYVVSREGVVYTLLPTTVMGRHTMGFNHVAIGIENVGTNEHDLTDEQVKSNAALCAFLIARHPSIEHIIGHQDYMNQSMPHFKYYLRKDKTYNPMIKIDPGWTFMKRVKKRLQDHYNIFL